LQVARQKYNSILLPSVRLSCLQRVLQNDIDPRAEAFQG
jgi:hypothetical protein